MIIIYVVLGIFVAIQSGNAAQRPNRQNYDVIDFGKGNSKGKSNSLFDELDELDELDDIIAKPKSFGEPKTYRGRNSKGQDCTCDSNAVDSSDCNCCCKDRGPRDYLPPDNCKICPRCYCDYKTFKMYNEESGNCPNDCKRRCYCDYRNNTLINEDVGNCPRCQPHCTCDRRTYTLVNPEAGNCPHCERPCTCDTRTYTLVNEEAGNCPACRPRCYCDRSTNPPRLVNEESGYCPSCVAPTCHCEYGRLVNKKYGNCPDESECPKPPCRCVRGEYVNESSGNCKPKSEICSCFCDRDGKHVFPENGPCPTCAYYNNKPAGYDKLPKGLID